MAGIERSWIVGRLSLEAALPIPGRIKQHRATDSTSGERMLVRFLDGADPAYTQELERISKVLMASPHPALVPVVEAGVHQGRVYWVTPLIEAITLEQVLAAGRPVSFAQSMRLLALSAEAVEHAHSHGLVHGLLRPANILLLPDGRVMISDMGLGWLLDAVAPATGFITPDAAGAPLPAPPAPAADLEALAVLNQLLLARRPSLPPVAPSAALQNKVSVMPRLSVRPTPAAVPVAAAAPVATAPAAAPPAAAPAPVYLTAEMPIVEAELIYLPPDPAPSPASVVALAAQQSAPPPLPTALSGANARAGGPPKTGPEALTTLMPFAGPPVALGPDERGRSYDTLPMPKLHSSAPPPAAVPEPDMSAYTPSYVLWAQRGLHLLEKAGMFLEQAWAIVEPKLREQFRSYFEDRRSSDEVERLAGIGWMTLPPKQRLAVLSAALLGFLTVLWISRPAPDLGVRPLEAQVSGSAAEETREALPRRGNAVLVDKKATRK